MQPEFAHRREKFSNGSRSRGFTLVEVLVAIVILSLGVLGAVGLQAAALQANKEARYQSEALGLVKELAERMRGNHAVALQTTVAQNPYLLDTTLTAAPTAPALNCFTTSCAGNALALARWDIYEWQLRLQDALPSPRVVICMDSTPFAAAGTVDWACDDTGTVAVLKLAWNRTNTTGNLVLTSDTTNSLPLVVIPLTAGSSE